MNETDIDTIANMLPERIIRACDGIEDRDERLEMVLHLIETERDVRALRAARDAAPRGSRVKAELAMDAYVRALSLPYVLVG